MKIDKLILNILFLPILLTRDVFKSKRGAGKKILYAFVSLIILCFVWGQSYSQIIVQSKQILFKFGLIDQLNKVQVRGTSMAPVINNGSEISLHNPNMYKLERGDIISFQNIETGNNYYVKRIVGMPQEQVMLKNGHVFIDGKYLKEPYVLNNLPTYGNTFLKECTKYSVPKKHYLVLGDNRTVSQDSRVLGFISKNDIEGVIKMYEEYEFANQAEQAKILKTQISKSALIKKINLIRGEYGAQDLAQSKLLGDSAQQRAKQIVENFEEWKTKTEALDTAHEFVTFGYLNEESIVDQIMESQEDKSAFTSSDYMEIGIGIVEKQKKECSFPVIVSLIARPSTPTSSQGIITE